MHYQNYLSPSHKSLPPPFGTILLGELGEPGSEFVVFSLRLLFLLRADDWGCSGFHLLLPLDVGNSVDEIQVFVGIIAEQLSLSRTTATTASGLEEGVITG